MYWENGFRFDKIASIMSLKQYEALSLKRCEALQQYLYASDNTKKNEHLRNDLKKTLFGMLSEITALRSKRKGIS